MNLSNLVLITFVDENINEVIVNISENKPVEFFIPRDNNCIISPMILQNISSLLSDPSMNDRQFNFDFINITQINSTISLSVHFEMFPLDLNLGCMLIYKFDDISQLNSSIQRIDDWTLLCPYSKKLVSISLPSNMMKQIRLPEYEFGIRFLVN